MKLTLAELEKRVAALESTIRDQQAEIDLLRSWARRNPTGGK